MNAAIIAIGNELLNGQSSDTNSKYLVQMLKSIGIATISIQITEDNNQKIIAALNSIGKDVNVVLVTGGLGPTHDDVTMTAAAQYFNSEIVHSEVAFRKIKELLLKRGIQSRNVSIKRQARVPEKAELIPNQHGTAQGLKFYKDGRHYYFLPGVPVEMKNMFEEFIMPKLSQQNPNRIISRTIHATGISESALYEIIERWISENPHINVSILPHFPEVRISLSAQGYKGAKNVDKAVRELSLLIGDNIFGFDDDTLESVVAKQLIEHKQTIATAESCTGGLIANRLTDISGSSVYFMQGLVTYSNQSKIDRLRVSEETLQKFGAVSHETALEMARNVRKLAETDIGLSTTGIAGPSGGSIEKPVGTVYIGFSTSKYEDVFHFQYNRDRLSNKLFFSQMALNHLRLFLKGINE